jgi:hypothetical protein
LRLELADLGETDPDALAAAYATIARLAALIDILRFGGALGAT